MPSTSAEPASANSRRNLNAARLCRVHLLAALQPPALDRALAREGKIYTRGLARRARATGIRRLARHREALELTTRELLSLDAGRSSTGLLPRAFPASMASRSSTKPRGATGHG